MFAVQQPNANPAVSITNTYGTTSSTALRTGGTARYATTAATITARVSRVEVLSLIFIWDLEGWRSRSMGGKVAGSRGHRCYELSNPFLSHSDPAVTGTAQAMREPHQPVGSR